MVAMAIGEDIVFDENTFEAGVDSAGPLTDARAIGRGLVGFRTLGSLR